MKFRLVILLFMILSSGLMYADTLAYYTFEEGSNGAGATGTSPTTSGWVLSTTGTNAGTTTVASGYPAYINNVAFRSMGKLSMKFGAKNNAVVFGNASVFQWSEDSNKTLEFYIRRDGNGPDGSSAEFIFSKNYTSSGGWQILFDRTTRTIKFQIQTQVLQSVTVFNDLVWHHVAIRHVANSGTYELFVDYVKEAEVTGFTSGSVTSTEFLLGRGYGWQNQRVFNGAIDDIRFSDQALEPEDFVIRHITQAYTPQPVNGAQNVVKTTELTWTPGDFAQTHKLYLGTDADAVQNATEISDEYMGELSLAQYLPALELGQTYYWRVDEINGSNPESPWVGNLWSFSVRNYMFIDDFESYSDESAIDAAWTFSDADPNNLQSANSTVGATTHYAGDKAMQIAYDLSGVADVSYASFNPAITDWTADDVRALSMHVKFEPGSAAADLQVQLGDGSQQAAVTYDDTTAINDGNWHQINITLSDFTSIDLTNIQNISIMLTNGTGAGYLYVDNIIILQGICTGALSADTNNDCRVDIIDLVEIGSNWGQTTLWP